MPEIYIGPFDSGAAPPPGVTPDWVNPHTSDYRNPAFSVVTAQGYPGCVYITLFARNHGNADVLGATVQLFGVAGVIDWTAPIPEQLGQLLNNASKIGEWFNVELSARPYPYIENNPWNTGQVLWRVPQDFGGRYVLFGAVSCGGASPGPVAGNSSPYDRSRDALVGVWSSVRQPRTLSQGQQEDERTLAPESLSSAMPGIAPTVALAGLSWIINRRNLLK